MSSTPKALIVIDMQNGFNDPGMPPSNNPACDDNVRALLEQLKGQPNRRAALVSTLVAVRSPEDPEPLIAVGRTPGLITQERIGSNGFGFDPVMWIEAKGKTFAQMSDDEKNAISHRGRAAQKMVELIQSQ